jgi:hypothetical protein
MGVLPCNLVSTLRNLPRRASIVVDLDQPAFYRFPVIGPKQSLIMCVVCCAHGADTVLRDAAFDELKSAREVRDRAAALIERLNGAVALSEQTRPLRFGGVIQIAPDGRLHRTTAVACPFAAGAQQPKKLPRLCFLTFDPGTPESTRFKVFFQALRDLGYVDCGIRTARHPGRPEFSAGDLVLG